MSDRFKACLAETLKWEGGWSDHKDDPGGKTMKGILQRVYDPWREKHGLPRQSVRLISDEEVTAIYRQNYWNIVQGDELPPGIDLAVFDFGVNSGPARGIRYLQAVLGVSADGHMGPVTIKAAADADPVAVVKKLMADRRAFLHKIPHKASFIKGWMRRCDGVEQACLTACNVPVKEAPLAPLADADAQSETQGKAQFDPVPWYSRWKLFLTSGAIFGGAASQEASHVIPAPSEAVTQTLTNANGWVAIVSGVKGLLVDPLIAAGLCLMASIWVIPWAYRKMKGA